jgi:hypothetical protein
VRLIIAHVNGDHGLLYTTTGTLLTKLSTGVNGATRAAVPERVFQGANGSRLRGGIGVRSEAGHPPIFIAFQAALGNIVANIVDQRADSLMRAVCRSDPDLLGRPVTCYVVLKSCGDGALEPGPEEEKWRRKSGVAAR